MEKLAPVKYLETKLPQKAPGIVLSANGIAAQNIMRFCFM